MEYDGKYERINTSKMYEDWEAKQFMDELEKNKYSSPNAGLIVDYIDWEHYYSQDEIIEMTRELNIYEKPIISNIVEMNNKRIHDNHPDDTKFNERYYYVLTKQIRDLLADNEKNPTIYVINEKIRDLGKKWVEEYDERMSKESRRKKTIINATHQKLYKYNLKINQEFESRKALAEYCGLDPHQIANWAKKGWIREG